jgi:hypothetical protein
MSDRRKREPLGRDRRPAVEEGKSHAQANKIMVVRTKNLDPAMEKRSMADLDEIERQKRLRNNEIMNLEPGKGCQQQSQRRGLTPSQEYLPALISREIPSSETQYSADYDDEVEEIKLQARLANKARNRAKILKEIERLGLTEQITLPPLETATPATSLSPTSKEETPASLNANIERDAQAGRRKLRKRQGLSSLLAPKPEALSKKEFSNSHLNQSLGCKAKEGFQKLKCTLSLPSRPSTPTRTDPTIVDTQKKIELARDARRNVVEATKYYEAPPRSFGLKSTSSKETSTPADLERKIELARKLPGVKAQRDFLDATSNELSRSFERELSDPEMDMKFDTQKKVELAREAQWKLAYRTLPDEYSVNHESLKSADLRKVEPQPEYDHASDTQKKIQLAREVRRRLEEEKARGRLPDMSPPSMPDCKHGLRYDLCRICGEILLDERKE